MMTSLILLALGACAGTGIWMLVTSHFSRNLTLEQRVAPWVSDISLEAHRVALDSVRRRGRSSSSLGTRIALRLPARLAALFDGGDSVQVLLAQAGRSLTSSQWRLANVEVSLWGALLGFFIALVAVLIGHVSPVVLIAGLIIGVGAALTVKKYLLARAARIRVALMLEELPALCELLAICLTAGEGFRESLLRITSHGDGPLVSELRGALAQVNLGVPSAVALASVGERLQLPPLSRMIDHVISSMERGAPIAEVLRVQASDARAEAGRRLQERASAREVVMLLPLVFLILPITIAFAIFPGLLVIQTGL